VLARDVQLVAANEIISMQLLIAAVYALRGPSADVFNSDDRSLGPIAIQMLAVANYTSQLFAYRKRRHDLNYHESIQGHSFSGPSLASCVTDLSRGRHCKDARDRLYAMLALAEDDLGIKPDYNQPLSKILNDLVVRSLLAGDLSILHASGIRPYHSALLASFVPSIENWSGMTLSLNAPELSFSTATCQPVLVECKPGGTMSIAGVRIDAITRSTGIDFSRRFSPSEVSIARVYHSFAVWHNSLRNRHAVHFDPYENMSLYTIFARIITLDYNLSTIQTSEQGSHPQFNLATAGSWYSTAVEVATRPYLEQRMIFETQEGFLGLGPSWMQPGDRVVIFDGGATPFILHKHTKEDADGSQLWKLVGDCFLLGWMDGGYCGHTVVDELPQKAEINEEEVVGTDEKVLVRERFVLC
jgi:hypothetical protein